MGGINCLYSQLSCRTLKWEVKTRYRVSLVLAHVTAQGENLKQQPVCQDNLKDVQYSGLKTKLAIAFILKSDSQDSPQQLQLCEVVYYHPN